MAPFHQTHLTVCVVHKRIYWNQKQLLLFGWKLFETYCTLDELLSNWKRVLDALQKSNLKLSPSKTVICPRSTIIFGWIWTQGVLSASPHRVAVLAKCPPPDTVCGLRSFIGAYKVLSREMVNEYIFKPKRNCRRKSMQEKGPIMFFLLFFFGANWKKAPSIRITVWHHSASPAMLNSYRRERIFNPQLTAIKNSYNKVNVSCSNICYTRIRYEISFVHTYVTYENVIWPNLC